MSTLETVISAAPYLHQLFPMTQLVVTDKEGYIYCLHNEDFFLEVFDAGKKFLDGSIAKETITTGKTVSRVGNKELTGGIPYQGTGVPILDERDQTIGSICVFIPTRNKENLQSTATHLAAMVQELSATSESMKAHTGVLSSMAEHLANKSTEIEKSSGDIQQMTHLIREISAKTKILGLNAGIEAARAGDAGLGFQVIAGEIRKLSEKSAGSSEEIREATHRVAEAIKEIHEKIQVIFSEIQHQVYGTEELFDSIDQVLKTSESLTQLSQVIRS